MNKYLVVGVVGAVIISIGSFFAGVKWQESQRPSFRFQNGERMTGSTMPRTTGGIRPVSGEIIKIDSGSLTVEGQDGQSRIVYLSDKTVINKAATGSAEDLKLGERVMVFGIEGTDKSITAENIQINPQGGMMQRNVQNPPTQ